MIGYTMLAAILIAIIFGMIKSREFRHMIYSLLIAIFFMGFGIVTLMLLEKGI